MYKSMIINELRSAVCSIGYYPEPLDTIDNIEITNINVIGTGFLCAKNRIITNRHVIQALKEKSPNQLTWIVGFNHHRDNSSHTHLKWNFKCVEFPPLKESDTLEKKLFGGSSDIGFLIPHDKPFDQMFYDAHKVPSYGSIKKLFISKEVGLCGYLMGSELLHIKELNIYRIGAITHFGRISALSPYDYGNGTPGVDPVGRSRHTNILSDITAGGGFSGSPLFDPKTGFVIGLHYAGAPGVGFAIPLDQERMSDLLLRVEFALEFRGEKMRGHPLGDLTSEERNRLTNKLHEHKET